MTSLVKIAIQPLVAMWMLLFHPFYVSVIEIQHNESAATAEISVRIFTEDLEQTLRKQTNTPIDLVYPKNKTLVDKQVSAYIRQKLHLTINGKPCELQYIGYEIQNESIWCYFEIPNITQLKTLEADCNLLYEFVNVQTNIFHVKKGKLETSKKLDYPASHLTFTW
jgi:hypothetical protein